jgi:hypothetical protein
MIFSLFDKKIKLKNDLTKMQLKGNVKELVIRFEKDIDPKYNKENLKYFRETERKYYKDYFFDSIGNIREIVSYGFFDIVDNKQYHSYNIKNELKYTIFRKNNSFGSISYNHIYYPKSILVRQRINGKKDMDTKKLTIENKEIVSELEKKYLTGRAEESKKEYLNGKIVEISNRMFKKKFKYDNKNNLIKIEYCHNGLLNYCYTSKNYEYNNENELIACKILSENPESEIELMGSYKYKNDSFGNWILKEITNPKDNTVIKVHRTIKYYSS